jgi:hypothetical protein
MFRKGVNVHLVFPTLCFNDMQLHSAGGHFNIQFPTIQLKAIQFTLWVVTKSEVWVEPAAFEAGITALATCRHGGWEFEVFGQGVLRP